MQGHIEIRLICVHDTFKYTENIFRSYLIIYYSIFVNFICAKKKCKSMEFSFVILRANKDILEDAEVSTYYVKNVYTHNEIPVRLRGKQVPKLQCLFCNFSIFSFCSVSGAGDSRSSA